MIRIARTLPLLLAGLTIGACASSTPRRFQDASKSISDALVDQLAKRTDARRVRVLVYDFTPCEPPQTDPQLAVNRGRHSEKELARRIKHQLISQLAPKVFVVEDNESKALRSEVSDASQVSSPFAEAERLGANAVLVGNYTVTGKRDLLVMARLVDVETNQILAAAEGTVYGVEVPHDHGG